MLHKYVDLPNMDQRNISGCSLVARSLDFSLVKTSETQQVSITVYQQGREPAACCIVRALSDTLYCQSESKSRPKFYFWGVIMDTLEINSTAYQTKISGPYFKLDLYNNAGNMVFIPMAGTAVEP